MPDPFTQLDRAREHQLNENDLRVLIEISNGATEQSAIATSRGLTRAGASGIIKRLATRKLITKTRLDPLDERKTTLAMTKEGTALLASITRP